MIPHRTALLAATPLLLIALSVGSNAATLLVPKDHPTIQDAIDSSAPGDTIEIGPGDYPEFVRISDRSRLTLRGRGKARIVGVSAYTLLVLRSEQITIEGLIIAGAGRIGIVVDLSTQIQVSDCTVRDMDLLGISVTNDCRGVTLEGNRIKDVEGAGIILTAESCIVSRNRISQCTRQGILVGGRHNSIMHNRISGVGEVGIYLETSFSLVLGNRVRDAGLDGMNIQAEDSVFLDNRVKDCGAVGFRVQSSTAYSDFSGNMASRADAVGIAFGGNRCFLGQSRIHRTNDEVGLVVSGSENLVVDNSVKKAASDGMWLSGSENSIVRNRLRKSGGFDLFVTGTPNELVQNDYRTSNL